MVPTDIRYDGAMSELGQSRHSDRAAVTSGLPLVVSTGRRNTLILKERWSVV
jgi:hypothetical protein